MNLCWRLHYINKLPDLVLKLLGFIIEKIAQTSLENPGGHPESTNFERGGISESHLPQPCRERPGDHGADRTGP